MSIKPFWCYYGGKYRIAPRYPAPLYSEIVEPFAGAAGYSTRYPDHRVTLVDADPTIAALWAYLIRVSAAEIRALPLEIASVDDIAGAPEARSLVGFWLNKGTASPCRTPSAWMRAGIRPGSFWGAEIRERIASQVDRIRHWKIIHGSYTAAPTSPATWFVDPPYAGKAGRHYRHNAIDFAHLAQWCRMLPGQVMVCENLGADWLPFRPFCAAKAMESKTGGKVSHEALWTNDAEIGEVKEIA